MSTSRVRRSATASDAARLTAVVVLPTPPFWFVTAMILDKIHTWGGWNVWAEYTGIFWLNQNNSVLVALSDVHDDPECSTWNTTDYRPPRIGGPRSSRLAGKSPLPLC